MEAILRTFKQNNPYEDFVNLLTSLKSTFTLLSKVADKTKTKIDDGVVDIVLNAVDTVANEFGLNIPAK